jgi:hypothetical protein
LRSYKTTFKKIITNSNSKNSIARALAKFRPDTTMSGANGGGPDVASPEVELMIRGEVFVFGTMPVLSMVAGPRKHPYSTPFFPLFFP